jgi:hypothetical protein
MPSTGKIMARICYGRNNYRLAAASERTAGISTEPSMMFLEVGWEVLCYTEIKKGIVIVNLRERMMYKLDCRTRPTLPKSSAMVAQA